MIIGGLRSSIRIGVAGARVTSEHVDEAGLVRGSAMSLFCMCPLHGAWIKAHWYAIVEHAGPVICALLQCLHLTVLHTNHGRIIHDLRWGRLHDSFQVVIVAGGFLHLLGVCHTAQSGYGTSCGK